MLWSISATSAGGGVSWVWNPGTASTPQSAAPWESLPSGSEYPHPYSPRQLRATFLAHHPKPWMTIRCETVPDRNRPARKKLNTVLN
jgi:hypothetical protein